MKSWKFIGFTCLWLFCFYVFVCWKIRNIGIIIIISIINIGIIIISIIGISINISGYNNYYKTIKPYILINL